MFQFKAKVSPEFNNAPIEQLCLIFSGKIMKDHETLSTHNIKDGMTVHLVIRSGAGNRQQSQQSQQAAADVSQTPFGLGGVGGIPGMSNIGLGSANFMEMQQRMQSGMMQNPEFMRQVMDSPLTQSLMSNPEIMRSLIESNPQMRQLLDRNPEIRQMMSNPDVLRQTMEVARNPAMLQELMNNHDRGMSIQEPMDSTGSNPGARSGSGSTNENPWGGSGAAGSTRGSALFASPGMQSLLNQMSQNPSLMQNMMNAPYTQSMFQTLASDPDTASNIISSNPLFSGYPELANQMRNMMPTFLQQMQNPAVQVRFQKNANSRFQDIFSAEYDDQPRGSAGYHADPTGNAKAPVCRPRPLLHHGVPGYRDGGEPGGVWHSHHFNRRNLDNYFDNNQFGFVWTTRTTRSRSIPTTHELDGPGDGRPGPQRAS